MGGPARPLHEPGNHRSSERCSHRHSADRGSLIGQPTLLRITAPTPRPGARSAAEQWIARNQRENGDESGKSGSTQETSASVPPSAGSDESPATSTLDNEQRGALFREFLEYQENQKQTLFTDFEAYLKAHPSAR